MRYFYDTIVLMKKTFWFWLCFVFAVILAVYFSVRIIMTTMGHGANATIRSVSLSADYNNKNLGAIASNIGVAPGTKTYSANLDEIQAHVMQSPSVRAAAVRRLPNGNLAVRVKLHRAVALWTDGTNYFPVSANGTVINTPTADRPGGTVVFRGTLPDDISEIARLAQGFANQLGYLEWIENRRWNIHTNENITIMLPEDNPGGAISTLVTLDKNHGIMSKNIQILDMRDTARILVK